MVIRLSKNGSNRSSLATVTGQIIAAIAGVIVNMKLNKELHISLVKYKISGDVIRSIYSVGFPSIIMASVGSVMTFGMNKILMGFTSTATAVFGVYFKLQSFIFMPVFGLNNGMVPIVAYNYGARKPKRITKAIKLSIIYGVCIMLAGFAVFQLFPGSLLGIFSASDDMMAIGYPGTSYHQPQLSDRRIFCGCIFCVSGIGTWLFKPCGVCAASGW